MTDQKNIQNLADTSFYDKNVRDTKDVLTANGLILHERADGTCYFTSFAKSNNDSDRA